MASKTPSPKSHPSTGDYQVLDRPVRFGRSDGLDLRQRLAAMQAVTDQLTALASDHAAHPDPVIRKWLVEVSHIAAKARAAIADAQGALR